MPDLPEPDLSVLEGAVAEQLRQLRTEIETVWASGEADAEVRGKAFGELGRYYHAYELFGAADAAYAVAEELDSTNLRWPYGRGLVASGRGDLEAALEHFGRALEGRENEGILRFRVGETLVALGRLDEGGQMLEAAFASSPTEPAIVAALGELALQQDQPERAVDLLTQVLEVVPAANRLHYPLALAYRKLGDAEAARRHAAQSGEVGVEASDPFRAGLAELATGETAYLLRGHRAFGAGDFEAAAEAYGRAVEAVPDSARSRVDLAAALAQSGRQEEAEAQLLRAIELDGTNATAQYNLGRLLELSGQRLPEAVERYRRAAELQPDDSEARYRASILMVDLGRLGEAKVYLEGAVGQHPEDGRLIGALARLLAASPDRTLRDGERAAEMAQRVVAARADAFHVETLALALAESGRCDEAASVQEGLVNAGRAAGQDVSRWSQALARYQAGAPCRPPGVTN